jgi:hypothetical protein
VSSEFDGDSINDIIGFRNISGNSEIYFIKAIQCAPIEYSSTLILRKPRFNGKPSFGDMDSDGDLDIVYASGVENDINFLLNNGDGTFNDAQPNIKGSDRLYVNDIDGDGDSDIIGYSVFPGSLYKYTNVGGFFISDLIFTSPNPIIDIVVENIDNSADKEIFVGIVKPNDDDVVLISKDISGSFTSKGVIAQIPELRKLVSNDIDNNGKPNIICLSSQYVHFLKIIGPNEFDVENILGPSVQSQQNITFGDYDRDGSQDFIIAHVNSASKWYKNISTNSNDFDFQQLDIDGRIGADPMISIDLDIDGDLDYISLNIELDILENIMYLDYDKDGFGTNTDCDDSRADINPDQPEICDDVDNDCNGIINDIPFYTYYFDRDDDGFGSNIDSIQSCFPQAPDGFVSNKSDCNDYNNVIFIGNPESCDGFDNDCNGFIDEGLTINKYFVDADFDGFGTTENEFIYSCLPSAPEGYSANQLDCDDNQRYVNPAQIEFCDGLDNDCDGIRDDGLPSFVYFRDNDGDGFGNPLMDTSSCFLVEPIGYTKISGDCNDTNPNISPNSVEICDNIDNNCSGQADEGLVTRRYFRDLDGDGFGTLQKDTTVCDLNPPVGYSIFANDCNDLAKKIFPTATEECDNIDNNCNNQIDEGLPKYLYYEDKDNDGYGNNDKDTMLCAISSPFGYSTIGADCNDSDKTIYPGASELCDNKDNNCSGQIDEGFTVSRYFRDLDRDGYGSSSMDTLVCASAIPIGYSSFSNDCDDYDDKIYPGATELCDNKDNDCSGIADDGLVQNIYYFDNDGDGFGTLQKDTITCTTTAPMGYSINASDCDDADANINPGKSEICDNIDNNCSGSIDEGLQKYTYFMDKDGDGFGSPDKDTTTCFSEQPMGFSRFSLDCNDHDYNINPNAQEICDEIDNNCSGQNNEGLPTYLYYLDNDNDGFGSKSSIESCYERAPDKFVNNDDDCDDNDFNSNPNAVDLPSNAKDEDCDGKDSSLSDIDLLNGIYIINPTSTFIYIHNPKEIPVINEIFDITGKFIMQVESNKYVYIQDIPKGVYLYKRTLINSKSFVTNKFIVLP